MGSRINISVTKNEFPFFPDIQNNLELPEKERFAFILQKKSTVLHGYEWFHSVEKDGIKETQISHSDYIRAHVLRIENPPGIDTSGGQGEGEFLTLDILLTSGYSEFKTLISDLFVEIGRLNNEDIEVKKSSPPST